jgi:hypothetical protein
MGLQLFRQKVHQNRFGINANEFLAKHPMEQVDIGGMNAKAVAETTLAERTFSPICVCKYSATTAQTCSRGL